MQLSKEEKQKVFLGVLLAIGVVYAYFEFMVGPLNVKRVNATKELAAMDPKIAAAKAQIAATEALKARVPEAEKVLTQINQLIPPGAPIAWFPTLIEDFFKNHGVERVTTRQASDVADPLVEGYRRISWNIDIPKTDALAFAAALAEFENQQPLIETPSLVIEDLRDNPQWQRVAVNLTNTVKQ